MAREGWELGSQRLGALGLAPPLRGTPGKTWGRHWTPGTLAAADVRGGSVANTGGTQAWLGCGRVSSSGRLMPEFIKVAPGVIVQAWPLSGPGE